MMLYNRFFSDERLVAFTSDAAIDFTPDDFDAPLSAAQQVYLKQQTGLDVPQVFWRKQIHGDDILVAAGHARTVKGCSDADAYVTNEKNLPIAIRTADCVPVLIFDPIHQAIGVVHAGWKGTQQQITAKSIKVMQAKFNSRPADLKVVLGPSMRPCCYEVGAEFKEYFPQDIIERGGKLYADVVHNNVRQLIDAGIMKTNIEDSGICTYCNKNYFSFRREGASAGRMISLMMLR